jgi:hypothetical protein
VSTLEITVAVVVATFLAVIAAGYVLSRSASRARAAAPAFDAPVAAPPVLPLHVAAPVPSAAQSDTAVLREARSAITWPALVDESFGELPYDERLALANRLAQVADAWAVPILRQAIHEEREPAMLDAIVDALIAQRGA